MDVAFDLMLGHGVEDREPIKQSSAVYQHGEINYRPNAHVPNAFNSSKKNFHNEKRVNICKIKKTFDENNRSSTADPYTKDEIRKQKSK